MATRRNGGRIGWWPAPAGAILCFLLAAADSGTSFRISDCRYVYNLPVSSLGTGHYRVDIVVNGAVVGRAEFSVK